MVILLQQGKGDMAAAFGGGSSQSAFGARAGATVLSKATAILAALFMVGAMALAIMGQRGPGSVVSGSAPPISAPKAPIPATPTNTPPPTSATAGNDHTAAGHDAAAMAGRRKILRSEPVNNRPSDGARAAGEARLG
jgi:preprotein translocase subunit SecG